MTKETGMRKYKSFKCVNPQIAKPFKDEKPTYIEKIKDIFQLSESEIIFLYKGSYGEQTYLVKNKNKLLIIKFGRFKKFESILNELSELKLIPKILNTTDDYYIMEFVNGVTLENLIVEGKNKTLINYIISEATKELLRWHENQFFHGDIATRNIMIDTKGKVWLIDPDLYKYSGKKYNTKYEWQKKVIFESNEDLKLIKYIKDLLT